MHRIPSMFRLPMSPAFRLLVSPALQVVVAIALAVAVAHPALAEEAAQPAAGEAASDDAAAPAVKPMGPGGPTGRSKPAGSASSKKAPVPSGIQLNRRTTVSTSVNVHDKVLDQCDIETMLPLMIAEKNTDVTLVDSAKGTHLELKIVDIHAPNGGMFSGPKWITVEGRLVSGKTIKGDFTAKESSMASATACGMLHKVMLVMAGDIATWLRNPARDSRLGRAR